METSTPQPQQSPATVSDRQDSGPSQPHSNKVIVSGFPGGYTVLQLKELFPGCRVETLGWRRATLRFPSAAEAGAALTSAACVDGVPLTVTPKRDRAPRNKPHKPPQEKKGNARYPRPPDKELDPSLDPKKIDFSGDFHQQLDAVLAHVRLSQEEVARIGSLYEDVELALQEYWPGCTAHPFGSITSGLGVRGSDADCLVQLPQPDRNACRRACRLLRKYPDTFRQVLAIPTANTPIVKFLHAPTATSADVSFKTTLGVRNSRLLAFLLHADRRALPAAVLVKYWGRVGGFTGSGKLTNYALTLMMVFYLQRLVLPPVCRLQSDATAHLVDGWDTGFDASYDAVPPSDCDASIADLIGGFFEFYSTFDFETDVVSPYLGRAVKKCLFEDTQLLPQEYELYKRNVLEGRANPLRVGTAVCVQDPFEHSHNVACMVTEARAVEIKAYIAFAAAAYRDERERNCVGFLKKILLERPVIRVKRRLPDYRVVLKDPYLCHVRGDWREVVRDVTLQVFRNILKFTLTKVDPDEKENAGEKETTAKKERYLAVLTKPIWRRKQVPRDIHVLKCSFVERQSLITQEILSNDPSALNLPFKLEIQLSSSKNRRAVVSIRAAGEVGEDGSDVANYRTFGQFFMSAVQTWIYQLLEQHLPPLRERNAPRKREENTPPRDREEHSADEEYELSGPIVVHNSARAKESEKIDTAIADITDSVKRSVVLTDEFKFDVNSDKSVNVNHREVELQECSGTQTVDVENSPPVNKST